MDYMLHCDVRSSKNKHVVHFNVKAGDIIVWKFATKKRDIAFGMCAFIMQWLNIVVFYDIQEYYLSPRLWKQSSARH